MRSAQPRSPGPSSSAGPATAAPRNASGAFSAPAAAAGGVVSVASSSSSSYRLESSASNRASSWSPPGVEPSAVLMAGGRARVHARLAMEAPEEKHICEEFRHDFREARRVAKYRVPATLGVRRRRIKVCSIASSSPRWPLAGRAAPRVSGRNVGREEGYEGHGDVRERRAGEPAEAVHAEEPEGEAQGASAFVIALVGLGVVAAVGTYVARGVAGHRPGEGTRARRRRRNARRCLPCRRTSTRTEQKRRNPRSEPRGSRERVFFFSAPRDRAFLPSLSPPTSSLVPRPCESHRFTWRSIRPDTWASRCTYSGSG